MNTSAGEHFDDVSYSVSQQACVVSGQTRNGTRTGSWISHRGRQMKVSPADRGGVDLVEIRPGRCLHIRHINPRPPDTATQVKPKLPQCPPGGVNGKHCGVGAGDGAETRNGSPHKTSHVGRDIVQHQVLPLHKQQEGNDQRRDQQDDIDASNGAKNVALPFDTDGTLMVDVIFFIHGVGGSSSVWTSQIDYFGAAGYEIIAPDLIGHGLSCAPRESKAYTFKEILQDMCVIFDMYSGHRNVVIGHSYGASFAAVLAKERYHQVSRLVMISGGAPTPLGPQPGIFSMPECFLNCCQPVIFQVFRKNAFHKESKTCIPQEHAFDVPSYVLKYTMNGQEWLEGDDVYHEAIQVLTLLIHGQDDKLVSLEDEQAMIEAIPCSQLVVLDGASHMVMLERTREVNHIIRNFLSTGIPLVTEEGTNRPIDITHCGSPDIVYKGVNLMLKHDNS